MPAGKAPSTPPSPTLPTLCSEETGSAEELIAAGGAPVDLPPPLLLSVLDRLLCMEARIGQRLRCCGAAAAAAAAAAALLATAVPAEAGGQV